MRQRAPSWPRGPSRAAGAVIAPALLRGERPPARLPRLYGTGAHPASHLYARLAHSLVTFRRVPAPAWCRGPRGRGGRRARRPQEDHDPASRTPDAAGRRLACRVGHSCRLPVARRAPARPPRPAARLPDHAGTGPLRPSEGAGRSARPCSVPRPGGAHSQCRPARPRGVRTRNRLRPRSRREVYALVCIGQLAWLGVFATWAGLSDWSPAALVALGLGVSVLIGAAGVLAGRRFRR